MVEMKNIELGKFYTIHDGSSHGHPGLIVWKDDDANLYLAVKIGTSKNKGNRKLKDCLSPNISSHYVYIRPFLGKRKDFWDKPFMNIQVSKEFKIKCDQIIKMAPVESKSINRKDRRNFKRLFKEK